MAKVFSRLSNLRLLLALLLFWSVNELAAGTDFSKAGVSELYKEFSHLLENGTPEEFYPFVAEYEQYFLDKGDKVHYYKVKTNEGFYALRHHQVFRAMQIAKKLDSDVKADESTDYLYLPTGLMADIYHNCHNLSKAEQLYIQALEEVGDRDPKFSMVNYMKLAEMLSLKRPQEALTWAERSVAQARKLENTEFLSLSLATKAYAQFFLDDAVGFWKTKADYDKLSEHKEFNHRYDNFMTVAGQAFLGRHHEAIAQVRKGSLAMDSLLVTMRVYEMAGNVEEGFAAMKKHYEEMDSAYSVMQDASYDEMVAMRQLMKMTAESQANKRLASRTTAALVILILLFIFVYIMGRRRLMLKIWNRNRELVVARDRAEESDRMKTAFIRNMSHEIRTPLNAINGFSQVLCSSSANELDDKERKNLQQRISDNVESITGIVNELLELSKGESEALKSEVRPVKVCEKVVEDTKLKNVKGLAIRLKTPLPETFSFQCHAQNLEQILSKLMDNALKFTEKGSIVLECRRQEEQLLFTVTDTGIGVKEEDREHIFEKFVKLDEYKEGIGLGLPVCRRLARLMGGDVMLDNRYTAGSRFILSLPLE